MLKQYNRYGVVVVLSLLLLNCGNSETKQNPEIDSHRISTNKKAITNSVVDSALVAPDFTLPGLDGDRFQLSEHRGKVVVLNLFATWCAPCIAEIPDFIALQDEFSSEEVVIVGVSYDVKGWTVVRPFVRKHDINYPVILDKKRSLSEKYYTTALPNTFIINQQGELAHVILGPTNKKLLKPLLVELAKDG